jgi:FHA domain
MLPADSSRARAQVSASPRGKLTSLGTIGPAPHVSLSCIEISLHLGRDHGAQEDMMATLTCPNCAAAVKQDDLICFTCGANLPRIRPRDDDAPAPTTVMQEYLRPQARNSNISPAVLRLSFPTGNVEVPAGTTLLLGRDPAESLVAAAFADFENVSRRHATITMDDSGHASIRDESSTNGTFVNGDRVLPGIAVRLADGDIVRLAADVSADVVLPSKEPDPSLYSRPDHA